MGNIYGILNKEIPGITLGRIVLATFTAFIFFIIPALSITALQSAVELSNINNQSTPRAKVAGVSTTLEEGNGSNEIFLPILNISINLNSQSGLFIIFALILFAIAFILVIFLLLQKDPKHRKFKY